MTVTVSLILYIVPVTIISLAVSPTALKTYIPWINWLCTHSSLATTFVDMLQPMCIMGLMALLPPIILGLCYWQGDIALSWAMRRQVSRYFLFQVINVFLVTVVSGSILKALSRVVDEPYMTFEMLADSLPKVLLDIDQP